MNTTFEKSSNSTDEWYTPKEIIDALGKFDLDPCAPVNPLWKQPHKCITRMMTDYRKSGKVVYGSIRLTLVLLLNGSLIGWQSMATELHYSLIVVTQICFKM